VTVSARSGDTTGTASRTFTYNNGEITTSGAGKVAPAGTVRRRRFSALFGLTTLREGRLRRSRTKFSRVGELSIGGIAGRLRGRTPDSLKGFLTSTWITKSTLSYDRRRNRARLSGIAVATFATVPGQACIRYSLTYRPGRRSGSGRLSLLGGSGPAATTRGTASVKATARRLLFRLSGTLTTRTAPPAGLNRACQALATEVSNLPG
jgi:hypothetical protein